MPNPYFNEQLAQAHRQVLLQEAQQEQLLAELPETRHSVAHYIADLRRFGRLAEGRHIARP